MTGEGDEKIAVEMMRNGAQDYLVKHDVSSSSLVRSIKTAVHTCELQAKLGRSARHDNLTGLLNRSLFLDRIYTSISKGNRYGHACFWLYIDVDNFKQINDQYGHEAGDIVLKAVGDRVKQSCRGNVSIQAHRKGLVFSIYPNAEKAMGAPQPFGVTIS
ncbi:MAG: PleD family two-component response regulator [Cellvibrionaceae bacterium]|jgi:PleD family two-component response regulator